MSGTFTRKELYHRHQLSHEQIDDFLHEEHSSKYPESKAQHLGKISEFFVLIQLFTDAGIDFIPFKGPVLSHRIYNDPLYRSYNDLDFLINPDSLEKALDILFKRGYYSAFYLFPKGECRKKYLYKHFNEILLHSTKMDITIELHWRLFKENFVSNRVIDKITSTNIIKINFREFNLTVFNPEFELLYLLIHGGLHGWFKLKWLVDIKDILKKFIIDQALFQKLTGEMHAHRMVALCNSLLKIYFPESRQLPCYADTPGPLLKYAICQIEKEDEQKTLLDYIKEIRFSFSAFPGIRYKKSVIENMMFATDLAAVKWLPCSSLVYYLVSPFWKLWRGFR